ncbi:cob(I)yrinic acid a,c-diamide adenosyltransferase [Ornithinimicrobium humiphilum]|uniref:Corrinoid adenosyltransferase n=1 Tax=Ornithinimicrobium humiphilum TaxID=125288 RepID=A0A543KLP4_9MICO|nr:cob(I)yrinic acid a,c-diamide adenosyltransferase [Ornithinimicrobium humiphilum]TQM95980.1 ATP:cob(I)alamin adenosyltransferase [Ornithinimicrobium humiphilum]
MVNLTRIYTRTGDDGTTGLGDNGRTSKNDPRLVAYADSDETNSLIGVAVAAGGLPEEMVATLTRIQNDLFDVGADLSMPLRSSYDWEPLRVKAEWIDELEADCDHYNEQLEPLRSFILPGGTLGSAHLHVARTVARRAERAAWAALEAHGDQPAAEDAPRGEGGVNPLAAKYLNRLSDLLFILARVANLGTEGDVLWKPGGGRVEAPEKRRRRSASTDEA